MTAQIPSQPGKSLEKDDIQNRYLLFMLCGELYGCSIVHVQEIIRSHTIKPVPFMTEAFAGVINLRGQIVGVFDLAQKFQMRDSVANPDLILIAETHQGVIGILIDEIIKVHVFMPEEIQKTSEHSHINILPNFFEGVGQIGEKLVHLIDLPNFVALQDFRELENAG